MELAEALECRAFGATEKRVAFVTLNMRLADYLTILVTAIGLGIAVYVYFYIPLPNVVIPFQMPKLF